MGRHAAETGAEATALRAHALAIWRAGVDAVRSDALVRAAITREGRRLGICGRSYELAPAGRLLIVGCGKGTAGMARGLVEALGDELDGVKGQVNVPAEADGAEGPITLFAARPPGRNEPTERGVAGTGRVMRLARGARPGDLVLGLFSGGGSTLLPAPAEGITLAQKIGTVAFLSDRGASIVEMNKVRRRLSRSKGGALARLVPAGVPVVGLYISDVIGDPLEVVSSGPTADDPDDFADALAVLDRYDPNGRGIDPAVRSFITAGAESEARAPRPAPLPPEVRNHLLGNNLLAVEAAARRAEALGYRVLDLSGYLEGHAEDAGAFFAALLRGIREQGKPMAPPACIVSGGEPVVRLAPPERRGKGGRNQQVALAALDKLGAAGLERAIVLSGGTDGEDGPTDAAGAFADVSVARAAASLDLDPRDHLVRCDAYPFFERTGGLLRTGLTGTNVMDLRVVLVAAP